MKSFAPLPAVVVMGLLLHGCSVAESDLVDEAVSYLPLQVGNEWVYATSPDQAALDTLRVLETVTVDGMEYGLLGGTMYGGPLAPDTLRTDEEGRIWRYSHGEAAVFLDPTRDDGGTYDYVLPGSGGSMELTVFVHRPVRVETPAGVFENGVRFVFDNPGLADEEFGYVLVPGVGMSMVARSWTRDRLLHSYEVRDR